MFSGLSVPTRTCSISNSNGNPSPKKNAATSGIKLRSTRTRMNRNETAADPSEKVMLEQLDCTWYRLSASQRKKIADHIRVSRAARNIAQNMIVIITVLATPTAYAHHQTSTSKRQPML